jgi:hypothetical protein
VKNLAADLATQNAELAQALKIAASRIGFVVVRFSGRDESVMALFREADRSEIFIVLQRNVVISFINVGGPIFSTTYDERCGENRHPLRPKILERNINLCINV